MEYLADRQTYLKPSRVRRAPNFKETPGFEDWFAPDEVHRLTSGLAFINDREDENELVYVVPDANEYVGRLRKLYEFGNYAAVKAFLEENPFLIHLLFVAYDKIRDYFASSRLVLKVIADPEAQEERELFVFIQTKLPPKVARPLLAEFDREWWLNAMLAAKGEMNISLQYVRDER